MTESFSESVFFIAGPTASGKSAAALALAERIGGEIVNADAIQVYADLEILSARPSAGDMARAPHHLFGFIDGAERCSAGRWARAAAAAVAKIAGRGAPAVLVGGTGLYFRALEEGLSEIPDVPADIRLAATARRAALGPEAFREEVIARDPDAAWIVASDAQRLIRAWEVYEATGEPLSGFQAAPRRPLIDRPVRRVVVEPGRAALYAASEARFDGMLAKGALAEAVRLRSRGLARDLPVMKALGAAELVAHLDGDIALEAAVELAKRNTRRFAKRQLTWFRNQAPGWPRAGDPATAAETLLR